MAQIDSELFLGKDPSAAVNWLNQNYNLLVAVARRTISGPQSPELTEDAAQEAAIKVWRKWDHYDPDKGTRNTWAGTIARHSAVDVCRRESSFQQADTPDLEASGQTLEASGQTNDPAEQIELSQAVQAALGTLPSKQRQVIELTYWRDLTDSEIATAADIPVGTVKTRIRLGRQKLAVALADYK